MLLDRERDCSNRDTEMHYSADWQSLVLWHNATWCRCRERPWPPGLFFFFFYHRGKRRITSTSCVTAANGDELIYISRCRLRRKVRLSGAILAEVYVDWLIAVSATARLRTMIQHQRKNKTAINGEYMKVPAIRARVEHTSVSHNQEQYSCVIGFVKARCKWLLNKIEPIGDVIRRVRHLFRAESNDRISARDLAIIPCVVSGASAFSRVLSRWRWWSARTARFLCGTVLEIFLGITR